MLRIIQDTQTNVQQAEEQYVPLKKVNIDATIQSFAADVTITQVFRNDEKTSIEAVYCFPIEEKAAVYGFIARIDEREIVAQLKEKKTAQKEYSEALQQGHGAYLLEQDEKSQDNFIINVGALPSGKECQIIISYVTELDLVENGTKIRFVVPTTIAPRYNPDKGGISSPSGTTSKYVQSSPYTIDFRCQVEKKEISRISSTSHPIEVEFGQQDFYVIKFAQQNTHLDRDILLDIELTEKRSNTIVAVEPGAIMASFTPKEEDCQAIMNNDEITNEFIFVVDCSGSMQDENKIGLARQAMLLFLKSLPVNCRFNIIRFGSNYKALFQNITDIYNEENARQADELTKNMKADLGGTELLRPLQWLQQNPPSQGRARQIFLLTDGEISNVDEVLDLCRAMVTSARIFSFGLGHSPSRSLVKGLARATNGRFVFIPPNTSVDVHVGEQLQKALQSCITNIHVNWNLGALIATSVPTKIPPVYVNDRLIVYALLEDKSTLFDHNSTVELKTEQQHRLGEAKITRLPNVSNNDMIARLAAKALIFELQHSKLSSVTNTNVTGSKQSRFQMHQQITTSNDKDEMNKETIKKRIIELSLKYNILSPHTAFVGIEKRINANNDNMVLREVPIQISADDQHLQSSGYFAASANTSLLVDCFAMSMPISAHSFDPSGLDANASMMLSSSDMGCDMLCDDNKLECDYGNSVDQYMSNMMDEFFTSSTLNQVNSNVRTKDDSWPTDNQDIVRHLIDKQKFDGSWDLDSKSIKQLTGKALTDFQQTINDQVLVTAIIVVVLETRFASFSSMWHGIVQKARKRLSDLLGKDTKKLDSLLENIRKRL
ncbi:unnamed protein product [Rotaria sordida]|uniref:Uncharacterized protein n=1 Tax=Rotaria sordida TaxID=392033 RepID=A0A814ZYI2_9BILA|nr:unnamed protein product [Rotaria sordida]